MDLKHITSVLSHTFDFEVSYTPKTAAVMIILFGATPHILMTRKSLHLKIHAGEIAFPGGKQESDDLDILDTALRETREEINLNLARSDVISRLDSVTTLNSGFTIHPFVSVLDTLPPLCANDEVQEILHIPLESFLKTIQLDTDPKHGKNMYTLRFNKHLVWGASARMLKQIYDLLNV